MKNLPYSNRTSRFPRQASYKEADAAPGGGGGEKYNEAPVGGAAPIGQCGVRVS